MSGADLLVDGFPHGTVAGYRRGCKSEGGCPTGFGQTCVRADRRRVSEWRYSKALAKDREVEFLQAEQAEQAAVTVPSKPAKVAAAKRSQEKQARIPQPVVAEPAAEVALAPVQKHGTPYGYARGCRDVEACPGGEDGRSCFEAQQDYMREYRARKKLEAEQRAQGAVAPEAVQVPPAAAPEPVAVPLPAAEQVEHEPVVEEAPRPRGRRVLDEALRTLAEAAEMQRAVAGVAERALRTARAEIVAMRRETTDQEARS